LHGEAPIQLQQLKSPPMAWEVHSNSCHADQLINTYLFRRNTKSMQDGIFGKTTIQRAFYWIN
jgi:hypothetical protein